MSYKYSLWQERLRERLFEKPYPLWVDAEGVLPAASLWYCVRERLEILREEGVRAGDRILLALPPNRHFLAWMLAGLWEGCTIALLPPNGTTPERERFLDVSAIIDEHGFRAIFPTKYPPTPDVSLLLATSGTTTEPRWVALSAKNIFSVIDSHLPALALYDARAGGYSAARVLSVLPLHHAFGLIIDFFTAFFAGAEIVRDANNGRDTSQILALAKEHHTTHCSMVPLTAERLASLPEGREFLCGLQGGVIGGAPVNADLAEFLRTTRLRTGYGQTEAAPGITLGAPGVWEAGCLGTALGCETRTSADGILEFRGDNAHCGLWTEQGLVRLPPERWVSTGDYVKICSGTRQEEASTDYCFVGRTDDAFKLANGRFIPAPIWETLLKSRIDGCVEAMITTLDGEKCAVCLAFRENIPSNVELKRIIPDVLGISPEIFSTLHCWQVKDWLKTPKGSTDRRAMHQRLQEARKNLAP
jgi:acyl-CoA synthetase (AMP-forming)/AMP-acid ligase II